MTSTCMGQWPLFDMKAAMLTDQQPCYAPSSFVNLAVSLSQTMQQTVTTDIVSRVQATDTKACEYMEKCPW